jgi:hypothetical protein
VTTGDRAQTKLRDVQRVEGALLCLLRLCSVLAPLMARTGLVISSLGASEKVLKQVSDVSRTGTGIYL